MREFFPRPQARRTQISSGLVSFSWVRAPAEEIFFFLKSDIKWAFSSLESYVINLNGQNNLKIQKIVQEMCKIAIVIYLCSIHFKKVEY